jgi:DNA invertase Pin-like site-specific DNA recombinase
MSPRRRRCAVYTRKSTEEGLEQDYNSLEAQRDACVAYTKSQAGEGWTVVDTPYDDGGLSGATMERPALQRLLADIETGKIDIVVVYKVDRLTRSLADFAKIVEILDAKGVSFVSVTQQFNTTSSMGRLTLNVLLSFAQFEREVTAERIRDKIAASKKKGMWMGGVVPLGYDVIDRKLVVNASEAETVRMLFDLYRHLGTVQAVKDEADRQGLRTKARKPNNGSRAGGVPFRIGHLHKLFTNRLYLGEITHKGESYPGEHDAIVDREIWDAVQAQLEENRQQRSRRDNIPSGGLLTGLLFDNEGRRLSPHHCKKLDRRYRYYVTRHPDTGWRLPAKTVETAALDSIVGFLKEGPRVLDALGLPESGADEIQQILRAAESLRSNLKTGLASDRRRILLDLVERIELGKNTMRVTLRAGMLLPECDRAASPTVTLGIAIALKRRGVEQRLVLDGASAQKTEPDPALINAVTSAHRWFRELATGEVRSIKDLADHHGVDKGDVSRILQLAFLAPDIVDAILEGRHPVELTAYRLKRLRNLPPRWEDQRRLLGFN